MLTLPLTHGKYTPVRKSPTIGPDIAPVSLNSLEMKAGELVAIRLMMIPTTPVRNTGGG